jgi:hypothetical protein
VHVHVGFDCILVESELLLEAAKRSSRKLSVLARLPTLTELLLHHAILRLEILDPLALVLVGIQPAKATKRNRSGWENGAMSAASQSRAVGRNVG